jgi:flagellar assembly protein FliH
MSSSRIIKSQPGDEAGDIPSFSFKPIRQAVESQAADGTGRGFVPMSLFDSSELNGSVMVSQRKPDEPAGITLSEEELNSRLRESFQNGLQEGKNLAERGLINVFRALRTASESIHSIRDKVLRESEDELVKLIIMVSRKVILKEVAQDRTILSGVVKSALDGISERDEITVRLNPDDYVLVSADRGDLLNRELVTDRMHIKPDPTVLPGFCQIDTEMGTIDASIDAQLDEIYRRLLEERNVSAGGGA